MNLHHLSHRFRIALNKLSAFLAGKWQNSFYLYLAALFSALIVFDVLFLHFATDMRQAAFDMMVRYRVVVPKPDKDIVIVDINEASLAAMAKEYGRWPWPRQVLGEFVEQLERQQPKAVVFDILFSDPDVYNPDSDAYFDSAIAATSNTFFPMLRLDPADDRLSQIKPGMIPGVMAFDDASRDATIAVVLPPFKAILQGGRLGLHNIYPDADGIARQYLAYLDDYGWKIPSLPLRVATELGFAQPDAQRFLLNWRGKPFSYRTVSFSDIYADMVSKKKMRSQDEFKGKIVIIGSTAPSLFDVKPTPMSKMHPGVEILATAIDNLKHGDYLRFPDARFAYLLLTLAMVWATALGFYRSVGQDKFDALFGASQFILIAISYASINFTTTYINLTGPVTIGLAYFTIARLYALATGRVLEKNSIRTSQSCSGNQHAVIMLIRLEGHEPAMGEREWEKVRKGLEKIKGVPKSVEMLKGRQKGLWGLFENTLAISWIRQEDDALWRGQISCDIEALSQAIGPLLQKNGASADNAVEWFVHEASIEGGEKARMEWRNLFVEALLRWEQSKSRGNS
ncbi:MAG: CHASE2 domain-containing protein [Betaproteobacteria bacterium]|nr:CHASE2 domain-containing protein [Betaproteobacteria bacterium]